MDDSRASNFQEVASEKGIIDVILFDKDYIKKNEVRWKDIPGLGGEHPRIKLHQVVSDSEELVDLLEKMNSIDTILLIDLYSKRSTYPASTPLAAKDQPDLPKTSDISSCTDETSEGQSLENELHQKLNCLLEARSNLRLFVNEYYEKSGLRVADEVEERFGDRRKFAVALFSRTGRFVLRNNELLALADKNILFAYRIHDFSSELKAGKRGFFSVDPNSMVPSESIRKIRDINARRVNWTKLGKKKKFILRVKYLSVSFVSTFLSIWLLLSFSNTGSVLALASLPDIMGVGTNGLFWTVVISTLVSTVIYAMVELPWLATLLFKIGRAVRFGGYIIANSRRIGQSMDSEERPNI